MEINDESISEFFNANLYPALFSALDFIIIFSATYLPSNSFMMKLARNIYSTV